MSNNELQNEIIFQLVHPTIFRNSIPLPIKKEQWVAIMSTNKY